MGDPFLSNNLNSTVKLFILERWEKSLKIKNKEKNMKII